LIHLPEEKRRLPDPLDLIPPPPWEVFPPPPTPWEKREQKKEEIPAHSRPRDKESVRESLRNFLRGLGYQIDTDKELSNVLDSLR